MKWFWNHHRETKSVALEKTTDSQDAIDRASVDKTQAEIDLQEMKERARRIKREREQNHFAPLIWDAMKGKD